MHDFWGLEKSVYDFLVKQLDSFDASKLAQGGDTVAQLDDDIISINGNLAIIPVVGILEKSQSPFMRMLFGASATYNGLIKAVALAEGNPEVKAIEYHYDTPGGNMLGLFDAVKAIKDGQKPSVAIVSNMAASAGYALAAQADKIVARNQADIVGSIGVLTRRFVSEDMVEITSSNAPLKAPDASTTKGRDDIRAELDMMHDHLARVIAEGRGVTVEVVNKGYGRGGIFTGDIAIKHGMVDSIGDAGDVVAAIIAEPVAAASVVMSGGPAVKISDKIKTLVKTKTDTGGKKVMTLDTLLADNADAMAEYNARLKATAEGATAAERERVVAHLGNISHSGEAVVKGITEGEAYGPAASSRYMNAALVAQKSGAIVKDNPDALATADAAAAAGGQGTGTGGPDAMDATLDAMSSAEFSIIK